MFPVTFLAQKVIKNTGNGMFPVTFLVEISGIEPLTS